jgi:hypothetical protein
MRVRCAWCRKLLAEKAPLAQDVSSHSICRACLRLNLPRAARADDQPEQSRPPDERQPPAR